MKHLLFFLIQTLVTLSIITARRNHSRNRDGTCYVKGNMFTTENGKYEILKTKDGYEQSFCFNAKDFEIHRVYYAGKTFNLADDLCNKGWASSYVSWVNPFKENVFAFGPNENPGPVKTHNKNNFFYGFVIQLSHGGEFEDYFKDFQKKMCKKPLKTLKVNKDELRRRLRRLLR